MDSVYELKYHRLENDNWWFKGRRDIIFKLLKRYNKNAESSILDIGCSGGALVSFLKIAGFKDVRGIDISPIAIKQCHSKGLQNVFVMDAQKILFPDESFDVVIASDILEHIKDDRLALKEWRRILKPGGHLIVFVPAFNFLWSAHDRASHHYCRYSKKALTLALQNSDLEILGNYYWNFSLFFPASVIRIAQRFFSFNKKEVHPHDQIYEAPAFINNMLTRLLKLENWLLRYVKFPFGVSVFAVARKPQVLARNVICPVCGNQKGNTLQDTPLHVYLCALCGHSFTILPKGEHEVYGENYFTEDYKNCFLHPNIRLFKSISKKIRLYFGNRAISLLDMGCGKGDLLRFLKTHNDNVELFGIDLIGNENNDITFMTGDFFEHDFNRKFDVVTSIMSIEHVDDPDLFARKIRDILEPNGLAFIDTINSNSLIYRLARLFKKIGWRGPYERLYHKHHLQHYTGESLEMLLKKANFEIIYQKNHNFLLAAINVPKSNFLLESIYKLGITAIFAITAVFGGGMDRTVICRKK